MSTEQPTRQASRRTPNPYVFVIGCPRSGTTLLQRMVDAHPEIAITPETHWIPKQLPADGRVTGELLDRLYEDPRFRRLGIERDVVGAPVRSSRAPSYASFVSRVFDLYGERQGKDLVGDKTPGYVRHIATLHELWPTARFVYLIRDGRDVCLSALAWEHKAAQLRARFPTWADDPVTTAALWWTWHVLLGREARAWLEPELYYEVRYEALVTDPETECRKLCAFLSVGYDGAMIRFHEGRTRRESGLSAKDAWLPPTPGLRDWRKQMPAEDVERFEAAAGELLDELGYPRAAPNLPRQLREHAAKVAAVFPGRRR